MKIFNFETFVNKNYKVDEKKETATEPKKPAKYKNVKDEDFVFPHGGKVDGWHFPINTEARAKNALQRANQYDKAPEWYSGTLKSLVTKVANMVKKKYPDMEVSEKSYKPKKG